MLVMLMCMHITNRQGNKYSKEKPRLQKDLAFFSPHGGLLPAGISVFIQNRALIYMGLMYYF